MKEAIIVLTLASQLAPYAVTGSAVIIAIHKAIARKTAHGAVHVVTLGHK